LRLRGRMIALWRMFITKGSGTIAAPIRLPR
jgi:hypothetical protein